MKVGVMNTPQDGRARAATFQNNRHIEPSTEYNVQLTVLNELTKLRLC